MDLARWIRKQTKGSTSVVDLGAGWCDKLIAVHEDCHRRYAVEIFNEYLLHRKYRHCVPICHDMRDFETVLRRYAIEADTAMIIDALEHLTKEDAIDMLTRLKERFRRIIIMAPEGVHPQDVDATGRDNEHQKHHSFWYARDLEKLGFQVEIDPTYHSQGQINTDCGALFAVWDREY
jgi:hypothetical protein